MVYAWEEFRRFDPNREQYPWSWSSCPENAGLDAMDCLKNCDGWGTPDMRTHATIFAIVFVAIGAIHLWSHRVFPISSSSLFGDLNIHSIAYAEINDVTVIVI